MGMGAGTPSYPLFWGDGTVWYSIGSCDVVAALLFTDPGYKKTGTHLIFVG